MRLFESGADRCRQNTGGSEFVAALLNSQQQFHSFADNERDLNLLRIDVRGNYGGKRKRIIYQLIDYRDLETGFTSMQRTVGFTMSLGAQLILQGKLRVQDCRHRSMCRMT